MSETQWMTLLETASLMKKLPTQVTRMCEDGKLEYYREDGRYFVSRESIDLFMHPRSGGDAPALQGSNGTSRRKYGQAPDELDGTETPVAEPGTVNGQAAEEAVMEEKTTNTLEETASKEDGAGESKIGAELDSFIRSRESMDRVSPGDSDHEPAGAEALQDDATGIEAREASEAVAEDGETVAAESAEKPETTEEAETPEEAEAVLETDAVETLDAADEPEAPDASTGQVVEILADLREAVARHAVAHEAFCDEISRLADALEATLTSGEDKTSELTREISSLLARYSKR